MRRKRCYLCILAAIWLGLILDSKTAQLGASEGIKLCIHAAIPSLFPFFFISNLTVAALQPPTDGLKKSKAFFPIPNEIMIPAVLGGYPMGSSMIAQLYRDKQLSKSEAEKLLYNNQPGPAFLFGLVSHSFTEISTVFLLWVIVLVSWLLTAVTQKTKPVHLPVSKKSVTLNDAISSALQAMGKVCSWIVIFRIVLEYLKKWAFPHIPVLVQIIVTGILEITNGCISLNGIPAENLRFIICAGILSFGGICVTMQTASVAASLSMKPYLKAKLLQTVWAVFISAAVFYPVCRFLLIPLLTAILIFRVDFSQGFRYNIKNQKEVTPCCFAKK